ncbi:transposase [Rhizobium wuzhouense]|uniref:Transposase IS116/IS110/IS902 C-terminal domain-containing protein n=1 Tax=Rhizobium wuzhouense TaxID=1986026 RepID=A0ABX5NNH4_9HYPH|nr:hypothetical protein DMY87_16650 [Rhizobium wuzhouense]
MTGPASTLVGLSDCIRTAGLSMPEIDLTTAMAVEAFAPTTVNFRSRRDFATWPGLVPKRNSSGEKPVLA